MIKVTIFVLKLATALILLVGANSLMNNGGFRHVQNVENIDGQATIVFPSDPVNCGDIDSRKECPNSKDCEWDIMKGRAYQRT